MALEEKGKMRSCLVSHPNDMLVYCRASKYQLFLFDRLEGLASVVPLLLRVFRQQQKLEIVDHCDPKTSVSVEDVIYMISITPRDTNFSSKSNRFVTIFFNTSVFANL